MAGRLLTLLGRLDRAGRFIETALLVAVFGGLMLLAVGQIILREIFTFSFIWANELQNIMVLWLAMIAAVAACRDNRHIRIDALSRILPPAGLRVSRVLVDLFAAAVCATIAWQVYRYLRIEYEYQDTVLVDIPAWLAHSVMPVAFLLTAWRFAVNAVKKAFGADSGDESGIPL